MEKVSKEMLDKALKKVTIRPEQLTAQNMTARDYRIKCEVCQDKSYCEFERRPAYDKANKPLPETLRGMTLGSYTINEQNKTAFMAVSRFVKGDRSLYLYGDPGNGKTHLLVGAYQLCRKLECPMYVQFYNMAKLLKVEREEYETREESEERLLDYLSRRKILFLDDFSSENVSGRTAELVYLLLNDALENNRPRLFITGNKSLKFISENVSDRIASRISGLCGKENILKVEGEDWRLK